MPSTTSAPRLGPGLLAFFSREHYLPQCTTASPLKSEMGAAPSLTSDYGHGKSTLFMRRALHRGANAGLLFSSIGFNDKFNFTSFALLLRRPAGATSTVTVTGNDLGF